jgi:capsular polysaccharide biosynthesis protein
MDDEIDLRKYIDILIKRWREIIVIALVVIAVAAAGVLALRMVQPPVYQADATVAIVRTQTQVNLDDRFTTSSSQPGASDVGSRRGALLGLVYSGSIAEHVAAELYEQLDSRYQDPATLLEQIDAQLGTEGGRTTQSDLIVISASADSPAMAAAIANAWARRYVLEVNRIYGQVPDEMIASVQSELDQAQLAYEQAQRALEQFLTTSPLNALQREVQETQQAIAALQTANSTALSSYIDEILRSYRRIVATYLEAQTNAQIIGFQREQDGQRQLLDAYMLAYNSAVVDAFDSAYQRDARLIRLYYDQWLHTVAGLSTARTLQAGLADGGEGAVASTAAALQLLKLQMVSKLSGDIPSMQRSNPDVSMNNGLLSVTTPVTGNLGLDAVQAIQVFPQPVTPDVDAAPQPLFQVALSAPDNVTLESLRADLDGLVQGLDQQMTQIEREIATLNEARLSGEQFDNLGASIPDDSALVDAIRQQYPAIFQRGLFSDIAAASDAEDALATEGQVQASELLKLAGAETVLLSSQPDAPIGESIATLESRLQLLQSRLEAENAANQQFIQQRNLAWESFSALSTKQAELRLDRAAANSEVRMGTLAVPPNRPMESASMSISVLLAAMIGLLLAIFVAFFLEYLGRPPLFARPDPAAPRSA